MRIPELKGLRAFMERPAIKQVLMGLGIALPASAFVARVPDYDARRMNAEQQMEEMARADLVAEAWRSEMSEADRAATVQTLAKEYDVPVKLAAEIHEAAVAEDIDPRMAFGLVRAESRFRTNAVSPVGAVGLMQVMPATARWLEPGTTRKDLMDPETNTKIGFKYLRKLIDRYDGDAKLALTAYNRGPGTVSRILKRGGNPDNGYAEMVMTGKSKKHVTLMNAKFGKTRKGRG